MPKTEAQRRAACARAHGSGKVMQSMSKEKAREWCHAKKLDNGRDKMTRRPKR